MGRKLKKKIQDYVHEFDHFEGSKNFWRPSPPQLEGAHVKLARQSEERSSQRNAFLSFISV